MSDESPTEITPAPEAMILSDLSGGQAAVDSESEIEAALADSDDELAQFPEMNDLGLNVSTSPVDLPADGLAKADRTDSYEESASGDFSEGEINLDDTAADLDKLTDKAED
ncbi:MAG: hypothetical protein M1330_00345 [Armatimonadetes bacterium]|nr:hypothetical protein [Armatimonadota bacterium]